MTTNFKDFQDYIADLCRAHKLVAHEVGGRKSFFRMSSDEDTAAIPNNAASPYVVMLNFSGRITDDEATKTSVNISIMFLSKAKNMVNNKANEIERAQQEAYDVMMDFILKMKNDYDEEWGCGELQNLQIEQISFDPIGPVNQLEYGWKMNLPFVTNMPAYNPANWI